MPHVILLALLHFLCYHSFPPNLSPWYQSLILPPNYPNWGHQISELSTLSFSSRSWILSSLGYTITMNLYLNCESSKCFDNFRDGPTDGRMYNIMLLSRFDANWNTFTSCHILSALNTQFSDGFVCAFLEAFCNRKSFNNLTELYGI